MAVTEVTTTPTNERLDPLVFVRPGPLYGFVIAALAFLRIATVGGVDLMWSDDGVFLAHALHENPWQSFSYAHHGYLNMVASGVATILEPIPLTVAPLAHITTWAATVGMLAVFVASVSRSVLTSVWSRALLGASLALIPIAGFESVGSPANLQWSLLAAGVFALTCEPSHLWEWRASVAIVTVAALSAPAALTFAPLIWWRRERRPLVAGWLFGCAVQGVAVLAAWGERDTSGGWLDVWPILRSFVTVSLNGMFHSPASPLSLSLAAVAALAVIVWHVRRLPVRLAVIVGAALAQWWFTYGGSAVDPARPRYIIVPAICALAVLLAAAETHRWLHIGTLAVVVALFVLSFPASEYRTAGVSWSTQVSERPCVDGERVLSLTPQGWGAIAVDC